jgi:hypothetical protein
MPVHVIARGPARFRPFSSSRSSNSSRGQRAPKPSRVNVVYDLDAGEGGHGEVVWITCDDAEAFKHAAYRPSSRRIITLSVAELRIAINAPALFTPAGKGGAM